MLKTKTRRWFSANGCCIRGHDERIITHLLLDGGKMHVDDSKSEEFFKVYEEDMDAGIHNFISENKTPVFRLFFDLDFHDAKPIVGTRLDACVRVIHAAVASFFPGADSTVVVSEAPTKNKEVNKTVYVKTGVHLNFPHLHVSKAAAMKVRKGVLQKLEKQFGKRHADDPWHKVVDDCVFKANGLRMIGSSKMVPCVACKRDKSSFCNECSGFRKVDENRIYMPTKLLDSNFDSVLPMPSVADLLRICSLRSGEEASEMVTPDWFDGFYFTGVSDATLRAKRDFHETNDQPFEEDVGGLKKHKVIDERLNRPLAKQVQALIRKSLPEPYRDLVVTNLLKCRSETGSHYYLVRTTHTYCMNKVDYHSSNTIFFVVNMNGLFQKCFCRCPVDRKAGPCSSYRSKAYPVPDSLKVKMFPAYIPTGTGPASDMTRLESMLFQLDEKISNHRY